MRGKVTFWKQDFRHAGAPFYWGFICPAGENPNDKNARVYFSSKQACYRPVKQHDEVEYETYAEPHKNHSGPMARRVEKVEQNEP